MKRTLTFEFDETENASFEIISKAEALHCAIADFDDKLRAILKYEPDTRAELVPGIKHARLLLNGFLTDRGIEL